MQLPLFDEMKHTSSAKFMVLEMLTPLQVEKIKQKARRLSEQASGQIDDTPVQSIRKW